MELKDKLLEFLEQNRDRHLSGEAMAGELGVSRTAIWKAITTLKEEGYEISAIRNKGYRLDVDTDILSAQGIKKYLQEDYGLDINVIHSVDSTNSYVKSKALAGVKEGYTLIAGSQSMGRGRRGRDFYSPPDSGLYMSILLRPDSYDADKALKLTTMSACAVCEAIRELSRKNALIKWVNDIYIDDKKVSGTLTEGSFDIEGGYLEYAILGIGINVFKPRDGFPEELKSKAGYIYDEGLSDIKNRLAALVISHFMSYYRSGDLTSYIKKYKEYNLCIDRDVYYEGRCVHVIDIDDDCHLIVRDSEGRIRTLSSGEISISLSK